jgi:hypothetical protein
MSLMCVGQMFQKRSLSVAELVTLKKSDMKMAGLRIGLLRIEI